MMKSLKRLARKMSGAAQSTMVRASAQGDQARDRGAWGEAAEHYARHLKANPSEFPYWVQLGHAYKETGRYEDAEAAYASASRLNPEDADLQLCRGHLAKLRNDFEGAIRFYNLSFSLDGNPHAAREMANPDLVALSKTVQARVPGPLHIAGAVEGLSGTVLSGWVAIETGGRMPRVEVVVDDAVLAVGAVTAGRVHHLGQTVGLFSIDLSGLIDLTGGPLVHVREEETQEPLVGSPFVIAQSPEIRAWMNRHKMLSSEAAERKRVRASERTKGREMAFLIDLDDASPVAARATITGLGYQWSPDWTATFFARPTTPSKTQKLIRDAALRDGRIRFSERPWHEDHTTDLLISFFPTTDLIMVIDAGTYLEPEMVLRFIETASSANADAFYADEVTIGKTVDSIERIVARTAFSLDAVLSSPHLVAPMAFRPSILKHGAMVGALGGGGIDLRLRIVRASQSIAHIPGLLLRLPRIEGQQDGASINQFMDDMPAVIGCNATRKGAGRPLTWRIGSNDIEGRTLAIVVDASNGLNSLRRTIETLLKTTLRSKVDITVISPVATQDTLAYLERISAQINFTVVESDYDISQAISNLVLKHADDCRFVTLVESGAVFPMQGWCDELLRIVARADVGMVGPLLTDSSDAIVSAGLIFSRTAVAHHRHAGDLPSINGLRKSGHLDDLFGVRNASAVSGLCAVLKMETLETFGVDPDLPVHEIVPDLCLRLGRKGLQVLVEPDVLVVQAGAASAAETRMSLAFADRWATELAVGDPFYSPLLSDQFDFGHGALERMTAPARVRAVRHVAGTMRTSEQPHATLGARAQVAVRAQS